MRFWCFFFFFLQRLRLSFVVVYYSEEMSSSRAAALVNLHVGHVLLDDGGVLVDVEDGDGPGDGGGAAGHGGAQAALAPEVQQHAEVAARRVVLPRTNCHPHTPASSRYRRRHQQWRIQKIVLEGGVRWGHGPRPPSRSWSINAFCVMVKAFCEYNDVKYWCIQTL